MSQYQAQVARSLSRVISERVPYIRHHMSGVACAFAMYQLSKKLLLSLLGTANLTLKQGILQPI